MLLNYDSIGTVKDTVELVLDGESVRDALSYDVACSVFSQPAAFTLTFGWGYTAKDLIARFPKGTPFQLKIAGVVIQTGKTDAISCSGGATTVTVSGRDAMSPLFKDTLPAERAFRESTYFELTRKMMDEVGLGDVVLHADNVANRKAITGHRIVETKPSIVSSEVETEIKVTGGQRKVVYNQIKARLGERRYDFLKRHYEKAGLFLWAAGDGSFVLARPNADQKPSYSVVRGRGQTRNEVNVTEHSFSDNAAERYYRTVVYGRTGGGKKGRTKAKGEFVDWEMSAAGFTETKTIKSREIKTNADAEYAARRDAAQQIRSGWRLEYTFAGHLMPSLYDRGAWAIWAPDTVCQVADQELGLEDTYYVSDVNFQRSPNTTTRVRLMRRDALVFAKER